MVARGVAPLSDDVARLLFGLLFARCASANVPPPVVFFARESGSRDDRVWCSMLVVLWSAIIGRPLSPRASNI